MTTMQTLAESASPVTKTNENFATLSALAIYGKRQPVTTGLTWGYYGGIYNGNTIADGTVVLTNTADNYVVALRSSGVVSVSTGTTNWNSSLYARLYKLTTAGSVVTVEEDHRTDANGLWLVKAGTQCIAIAVGDETTAQTTGTAKVTFRMPYAFTLSEVRGSLTTAATGATLFAFDVKESGTTIFSTKPTFDATEKTTTTAATPSVLSDTALADDAEITINIDAVGNTIAGAGLKVYLIGVKA